MNLPNSLTLSRFALIPVYILIFSSGHIKIAFFVVVLAGLTDVLDGYIARKRAQETVIGAMLDPLADKMMMIVVILSLLFANIIPWTAAVAMFIRDAGMIIGSAFFHFRGRMTVPANMMGKITTALYYFVILSLMFQFPYAISYLWFVIVFSFITSFVYISKFRALNRQGFE